jgi:hypothetical protein
MLQIENGIQIATDNYYIQHIADGLDELHFELPLSDPAYTALQEESRILETTEKQTYAVKTISGGSKTAKIACRLDVSAWEGSVSIGYSASGSAYSILNAAKPSGWTVTAASTDTTSREIDMDGPTPLEIALQVQETFACAVRFDTALKKATLVFPDTAQLSNAYAVESVNLRTPPEFKGRSSDLYTRLYPVGKNGLQIASVNSGKNYVENRTYINKVICAYWSDSRYTDATALRDDAQKRVDEASQPVRSWTLSLADLYRLNPDKWPYMGVPLFTVLRLVDINKGFAANVQVREDKVYPYYPEKNEISASTVARSVQRTLRGVYNAINNPNSAFYQQLNARG